MPRLSARFGWQAGFCFGADDGARQRRWTGSTALCGFDDAGLHGLDGASAVTFDLFWPSRLPATFPKRISAKVIYRVTVTSPWGTVVYTTSPI